MWWLMRYALSHVLTDTDREPPEGSNPVITVSTTLAVKAPLAAVKHGGANHIQRLASPSKLGRIYSERNEDALVPLLHASMIQMERSPMYTTPSLNQRELIKSILFFSSVTRNP